MCRREGKRESSTSADSPVTACPHTHSESQRIFVASFVPTDQTHLLAGLRITKSVFKEAVDNVVCFGTRMQRCRYS